MATGATITGIFEKHKISMTLKFAVKEICSMDFSF